MTGKKILIIDDSDVVLSALSAKLKGQGYATFTAPDGAAAMTIVRNEKPDLILLDIGFPPDVAVGGGTFRDGYAILGWLRRMDEGSVPVIVITASEDPSHEKRSLTAGAIAFFRKPVDTEQLLAAIRQALGGKAE